MNPHITEASPAHEPRGPAMRFTYPGGSRPLEGYTIKRGIGRGGFGEVYYATSDAGKELALKLVRRNLEIEIRGVSQCLNLKHPNLLALYDIKRDAQDDSWVVMEYVAGESLEELLARHPEGLPVDDVLAWIHGMAAGVGYLHDRGIVHRDLKPGNVFNDEGCVKIGDYGLSKFISASRRSGQTESVGTVHYMAPEVANGRYGKEIDIYALGIMLYEMLTGHVPFEGESVGEVLMKHLTAQPDLSRIAEPFRSVVARALEKDPEKRLRSAAELVAALPPLTTTLKASRPAPPPPIAETMAWGGAAAAAAVPLATAAWAGPPPHSPAGGTGVAFLDEEPIWRFIKHTWDDMSRAWRDAQLTAPVRTVLIVVFLVCFLSLSGVWIAALMLYGLYLAGRAAWLAWTGPPSRPVAPAAAVRPVMVAGQAPPSPAPPPRAPEVPPPLPSFERRTARRGNSASVAALHSRTSKEQFTDLLGSLLVSAAVASAAALVMALWFYDDEPERLVWLGLVSTIGAWCVLVPAKFWEVGRAEPWARRGVLLCGGLILGLVAFGLDRMLFVDLPTNPHWRLPAAGKLAAGLREFRVPDPWGRPTLADYLAYFGLLLPVLRWWKQADPLRRARFSLGPPIVAGLWAMMLSWFWTFPQPWGMLVAGTMSVATQLASPWVERSTSSYRTAA